MKQLFRLTGRYAVMFAAAVLATSTMGSCKKSPQGIDGPDPSGEILPANAGVF